jgi:hypothetical protein
MKEKTIVPLAAALAALTGTANASVPASTETVTKSTEAQVGAASIQPNVVYKAGEDLLGLLVTQKSDGTVVAQHSSHYSHSSHASHASSRY